MTNQTYFAIGAALASGVLPRMTDDDIECPQCHSVHFVPDDGQTVCEQCDTDNYRGQCE